MKNFSPNRRSAGNCEFTAELKLLALDFLRVRRVIVSKFMTRKILRLIVLFSASVLSVFAQDNHSDDVIKVETALVGVPVAVSDRDGRYIANLRAEDFTIFADGKQQKVEFFAATEEPLNVALLIDTSRSTQEVLDDIKDAARDFLRLLKPQDKASVMSFDFATHVLSTLTSDSDALKRAVKNAEIGEDFGTALNDAIGEANRTLSKVKGRKAIIVLTDGKDAGSELVAEDLLYALAESDAPVYTAFYKTGGARRSGMGRGGVFGGRFPNGGGNSRRRGERVKRKNEEAKEFLQKISDETGGRAFSGEVSDLKKTFDSIVDELRFQYRLGFYPPENQADENPHNLKVKVARPGAVVRARSSYRRKN